MNDEIQRAAPRRQPTGRERRAADMTGQHLRADVLTAPHEVRPLGELIDEWISTGIITTEQAGRMAAGAAPTGAGGGRRGTPVLVETLTYVGGAVVLAGCSLLTAYYWDDLSAAARVAVVAAACLALLVSGIAVPHELDGVGRRLRSVLWLASTAAFAGAVGLLLDGGVLDLDAHDETRAVLVAAATTGYAGALWAAQRYGVQQVALMVSAAVFAGTLVAWSGAPVEPGVGVWAVGLGWTLLGLVGALTPAETPVAFGAVTAVLGAMTASTTDAGMVLTLLTLAAIVGAAVARRDLLLLGIGSVATLVNVPAAMARWFPGSVAAAVALVIVGLALVALAAWLARGTWRS